MSKITWTFLIFVACTGTSGPPPATAAEPPLPPPAPAAAPEAPVRTPEESIAATHAATTLGDAATLQVGLASKRSGDPIFAVSSPTAAKTKPPMAVLVREGVAYAGREGFSAWAGLQTERDAARLAVACTWLALGSRGDPIGLKAGRDTLPGPAFEPDGSLVFWYREPAKSAERKAIVTFATDGTLATLQ